MPAAASTEEDTKNNNNKEAGSDEDNAIAELRDWLWDRVADDRDVVVDDMQEEFFPMLEKKDDESGEIKGSEEYLRNVELLRTSIAAVKDPKSKLDFVSEGKQKITDGIRTCWYGGTRNKEGKPNGEGMLKYENKDVFQGTFNHGVLDRTGILSSDGSLKTEGTWKDGLMEGEMRIETHVGWIEGYYSKGVPHGYQREFGYRENNGKRLVPFVGRYYRGVRRGFCWRGCFGEGFICGYVDKDGEFTGDDLAYIYPDFKMVLRGKFEKESLVSGQLCQLMGVSFEYGMAVPKFTKPSGEKYSCERASLKSIGRNPRQRDPWEDKLVYVKESLLPQGGEGLFAKRDIKPKELVCLFNGVRLKTCLHAVQKMEDSDYRIRLNADLDLDIPNDCISMKNYCATLGHKANHSNLPNAEWTIVEHPRFGLIRGLSATVAIRKDDEILINYQMNLADAPEWYRLVWLQHQREYKKMNNHSIWRVMDRYHENTGKRIELELESEQDFFVPEPKGIAVEAFAGVDEDEEEAKALLKGPDDTQVEDVKKLLKIKGEKSSDSTKEEGPKITELLD